MCVCEDAEYTNRVCAVCCVCFASVLSFWLCLAYLGVSSPEPRLFPCLLAFEKTILGASLKELVDQDQTVSKQVVESLEDQKGYATEFTEEARGTAGKKEGRRVRNVLDDLSIQKGKPQARREEVPAGAMRRLQG